MGTTTAWRYVRETTALLTEQVPTLEQRLRRAHRKGWGYVIVDGTLIACDRVAADRPFYSGKHKQHGMNVQVVAAPNRSNIMVYTQLRLARGLVVQERLPWHRVVESDRMSPARVRRGFRYIHADLPKCVGAPKPSRPGPGRPPGRPNKSSAPRYGVPKKNKTGATSRPGAKQAG
ncbi:hypothetical protein GCM10007079_25800 [Nocardiopsis terrae]|nr:hypothetical protein GCM10007079_25800 [Nocardiopsis terrae]